MLNLGPLLPYDLSCPSCTKWYLNHQAAIQDVHSNTPASNGSGIYVIRPEQVQKAQLVIWGSSSKVHSPHFCYTTFSLPSCACDHGENRQGKTQASLVYEWFCTRCRHYLKVDGCCPHPIFGTSLKDGGEGKSSLGTELEAVSLAEGEHAEWSRTWKSHDWSISHKENRGRGMWTDFFE